jgi:hypothetical protein
MRSVTLSEPEVLASAKRRLFPDRDEPGTYAVTDTQFAQSEWLDGQPIAATVRDQLAPFNHVRVGSGYPDLVGVRRLDDSLLATDDAADQPPLVAVEAKGHTGTRDADVDRGVTQAYDRLTGVNAAYVAAPRSSITRSTTALARELNVGVLGVDPDGTVDALEIPRVVGTHASTDAAAVRFQASAQGVVDKSFGLNHPKNYLGVPLALYATGETDRLLADHVVGATADARTGAAFLGLVESGADGLSLTPLGAEVVRFGLTRRDSARAALEVFAEWKRSQTRFTDLAPAWGQLARRVMWMYPATQLLVEGLQTLHDAGHSGPSLIEFVEWLHDRHPTFAVELFVRGTTAARSQVLDEDGQLVQEALASGTVYHAPTVFQLKAMLYHAGLVTDRGAEPSQLSPTDDVWALCTPIDRRER